jgi:hypothetical protein
LLATIDGDPDILACMRGPDAKPRVSPYRPPTGRKPTHAGCVLTRVLRTVRLGTIDGRSQVGCALRKIREELTAQLGGEAVPPTLAYLIDETAKKIVITTAVGEYILRQATLVSDDALIGVVEQHDRLQRTLVGMLQALGLERVPAPVEDFRSYAQRVEDEQKPPEPAAATPATPVDP